MTLFFFEKPMSETILEVKNLSKEFAGKSAVSGLSFSIRRGEIVGLLGANGAGKTTAMHMLLGLIDPSAGTVKAFGQDLFRNRVSVLKRMNFTSAYANLPSNLTVGQNLYVFAKLYGVKDHREKIDQLLREFEVDHLRKSVTGHLSSGESARVNLCKALLNDPELLMLDEPTASLDPDIADKVRKMLKTILRERGLSVLYTSHNMRDIEEICDRIIFVQKGKAIAEGTAAEILARFEQKSLEDVFIHLARDGEVVAPKGEERDV